MATYYLEARGDFALGRNDFTLLSLASMMNLLYSMVNQILCVPPYTDIIIEVFDFKALNFAKA